MGYCTRFVGEFQLDRQLEEHHLSYLKHFSESRRMKRDEKTTEKLPDIVRAVVGLPVGSEGEYYVGNDEAGILDQNQPPSTQPGLWCCWTPDSSGQLMVWSGTDKPYGYQQWLSYIIHNFLHPWKYQLTGEVGWLGEDNLDSGVIKVDNSSIETIQLSDIHSNPVAARVIECLKIMSDRTQPSKERLKSAERIITDIDVDSDYWLYLPTVDGLVNCILEDQNVSVINAATNSLNTLLDRGIEIPNFMMRVFMMFDFSRKPRPVVDLVNRIKQPVIEKYGILPDVLPSLPSINHDLYIEPFAIYWKDNSLEISAEPSSKMKLTREQTEKFKQFLVRIVEGEDAGEEIVLESDDSILTFSKNSFSLQCKDGLNISSSFYFANESYDPSFDDLLKGLKKAMEIFDTNEESSEEILLNSPWSD